VSRRQAQTNADRKNPKSEDESLGQSEGVLKDSSEPPKSADRRRNELDQITEKVIGSAYAVRRALGSGFLEKVYENALAYELREQGLKAEQQHPIPVRYRGSLVGDFAADILVEGAVLVELKAVRALDDVHTAQCINYLKGTGLEVCLLLNFGTPRVQVKRIVNDF